MSTLRELSNEDLREEYVAFREEVLEAKQLSIGPSAFSEQHLQQLKLEMERRGLSVEV